MFTNLMEFETPRMNRALNSGAPLPAADFCQPTLGKLDYLFLGVPTNVPNLYVAGGVLPDGTPVSGAGHDEVAALTRLAGEAAEQFALRGPMPVATRDLPLKLASHPGRRESGPNVCARTWEDGQIVALPAGFVPLDENRVAGYSEGMAAHTDIEEACVHAALELIERDAAALWWSGAAKAIALDGAGAYAKEFLGPREDRDTHLLDITCDTKVPVALAMSFDASGRSFSFGAAAAGSLSDACDAALRELGSAEFGLVLESNRASDAGAKEPNEAQADFVDRNTILSKLVGGQAELDAQSKLHVTISAEGWPAHLAPFNIYFIDLGLVGEHFHVVKAVSESLQPGRETHFCSRYLARTAQIDRPFQGSLY